SLRTVVFRPKQAEGTPREGPHARCAKRLPKSHAQDLRLRTGADAKPFGDHLAPSRPTRPLPEADRALLRGDLRRKPGDWPEDRRLRENAGGVARTVHDAFKEPQERCLVR